MFEAAVKRRRLLDANKRLLRERTRADDSEDEKTEDEVMNEKMKKEIEREKIIDNVISAVMNKAVNEKEEVMENPTVFNAINAIYQFVETHERVSFHEVFMIF